MGGRHMLGKMTNPQIDLTSLVLRLGLAAVFIVHGYWKIVQDSSMFPELSYTVQNLVGWGEMIFGAALAFGFLSRIAALGIIVLQVGAIIVVTGKRVLE